MPIKFEVKLDEELQIIRQWVEGNLDLETFREIDAQTDACAGRLRDPSRVRVLVSAPKLGHARADARRTMAASMKRPNLFRLAVYDATPVGRVMIRFMTVLAGINNTRAFATEAEALAWLLS
jgi:hypothetical protein